MLRMTWTFFLFGALPLVVGCNGSSGTIDGKPRVNSDGLSPAAAVRVFLEAVRTGDDDKAASMLTQMAREETSKIGMVVAPPGSETASFEVGEAELMPNDIAHVSSTWSDEGEEHEIVWALRKEPEGWRIAGMATKIFEDLDPVLLTFEDPEDMMAQQQAIEEEMLRRVQAANQTESGEGKDNDDTDESAVEGEESESTRQATRSKEQGTQQAAPASKRAR